MFTKTVRLVSFTDEMTGQIGLGLADMPKNEETNAAWDGLLIAHDLLEHSNGAQAIGTIDDELEAVGGIWYVRGQHGELRRDSVGSKYNIRQSIAYDIIRMFRDFFYGSPVDTNTLPDVECEADDDLREIIKYALQDMRQELDSDDEPEIIEQYEAQYIAVCLPRMRLGYEKAKANFEQYGRFFANDLFWAITDAINPHIKCIGYEGQEYKLIWGEDVDGMPFAVCEEFYPDEFEDVE